jgi:hypothetical protein
MVTLLLLPLLLIPLPLPLLMLLPLLLLFYRTPTAPVELPVSCQHPVWPAAPSRPGCVTC